MANQRNAEAGAPSPIERCGGMSRCGEAAQRTCTAGQNSAARWSGAATQRSKERCAGAAGRNSNTGAITPRVRQKPGTPGFCWCGPSRHHMILVGVRRFELRASSSRTKRATKLRHTPISGCGKTATARALYHTPPVLKRGFYKKHFAPRGLRAASPGRAHSRSDTRGGPQPSAPAHIRSHAADPGRSPHARTSGPHPASVDRLPAPRQTQLVMCSQPVPPCPKLSRRRTASAGPTSHRPGPPPTPCGSGGCR